MRKLFLSILICLLSTSVFGSVLKWAEPANWGELEQRMTGAQVSQLLGNPKHRDSIAVGAIWYYQEGPRVEGTKIIRPDYGIVRLRMVNRVLVVVDWAEPDWDKLAEEETPEEVPIEPEEPPEQESAAEETKKEEPVEQAKPTTTPFSRRPERDYSPEALAKQRAASRLAAEKAQAERRARREKLAAEYAEIEPEPAKKKKSLAHPFFLLGGLLFMAGAVTFIVYKRFCEPE